MKRVFAGAAIGFAGLLLCLQTIAPAQAKAEKIEGYYRITLHSGSTIEGQVTERDDGAYEVEVRPGIIMTVRKGEVRQIRRARKPGEEASQNPVVETKKPTGLEGIYYVTDAEIAAILEGIEAQRSEFDVSARPDDLMPPLELDEASLADMLYQAGLEVDADTPVAEHPNVLIKDHFVFVYTSTADSARKLASRLESVYRWNVRFMEMMDLPARRPVHKLEIFYFGTFDEYAAYSRNQGNPVSPGTLGYYVPAWNRSHFFDLVTSPFLAGTLEALDQKHVPWKRRQYLTNVINRWVDFHNVEVVQHEAGHHIHFNIGLFPRNGLERESSIPIWLVEGTTMLFEFPVTKAGASLGVLNHYRLDKLRKMFGEHPGNTQWWKMFLIDNNMWQGGPSYMPGWAMTYYLFKEHRDGYAEYLQKVFGREPDVRMSNSDREAEFEEIFGRVDDEWIEDFYEFLDSLHVKRSLLPPDLL